MKRALSTSEKEYIKSDHFIHDYLIGLLIPLTEKLRGVANNGGEVSTVLMFWPDKKAETTDNDPLYNAVIMDVADPSQMAELAQGGAAKTKANAIALVQPYADGIKIGLETRVGTELWDIQKQKRGDIYFFKSPERSSNVELLNVLWKQG